MNYINELKDVFSRRKNIAAFLSLAVIFAVIFSITSGILLLPYFELSSFIELPKLIIVGIIVALISLNGTVLLYNFSERRKIAGTGSLFGLFTGFFTTACPVCQPIWLIWLGLGSSSAFVSEISIYIGIASIILLSVSLHFSLKSKNSCEVGKSKKQ